MAFRIGSECPFVYVIECLVLVKTTSKRYVNVYSYFFKFKRLDLNYSDKRLRNV